jgi:hypothetical protein
VRTTIDIRCANGIWADLRIANDEDEVVCIPDPGDFTPTEGWEYSRDAYRVTVLRSFRYLEMELRTSSGTLVEPAAISTLADHRIGLPVKLQPGAELVVPIPLHEFYDLERDVEYSLSLAFGDAGTELFASAQVQCR